MQTTLLGLGIALILALVAALVGPIFVDWGRYRESFEAEAARMVGLPVRIGGAIDVRLLPTPSINLRDVEVGSRAAPIFGAEGARAELSLGPLMRGEIRAAVLTLDAPDVSLGLDGKGRVAVRGVKLGVDLDKVSIDRVVVENGSLSFDDAASGVHAVLGKVSFDGEMRSLVGQVRGEGGFSAGGHDYHYQISTGRPVEGVSHVRLALDPADRPLSVELDGNLSFEDGAPRYDGNVTLSRPAGAVLADGKTVAGVPWRIAAKARADAGSVSFENIDAQYGPEERSLRLAGNARLTLGGRPDLSVTLAARQVDIDRTLADPALAGRPPLALLRGLGDSVAGFGPPPVPLRLNVSVDALTVAGATLQSVRGDVRSDGDGWIVDSVAFRAPGFTQVALSGRLDAAPGGEAFKGPVSLDSTDPRTLLSWLEGAGDDTRPAIGPFHLRGDVTLAPDRVAADRVQASADRDTVEGRVAYVFAANGKPARLEARLNAAEFDLDSAIGFVTTAFAGSSFERPGEIALAADLGHATYAGTEATAAKINLKSDASGLKIEQLSIADLGGAAIDVRGTIDTAALAPRGGALAVAVRAKRLDGLAALAAKFAPTAGDALKAHLDDLAPAAIDATLKVDPPAAASDPSRARLDVTGSLGRLQLAVSGEGAGDLAAPTSATVALKAELSSADGALLSLLGLDRLVGGGPARLALSAGGPANGDLRVDVGLSGAGLDAAIGGTVHGLGRPAGGALRLTVNAADLRGLNRGAPVPLSLKSAVALDGTTVRFDDVAATAGGVPLRGALTLTLDDGRIDGRLAADSLDLPTLLAAMTGAPAPAPNQLWATQPFAGSPFGTLRAHVALDAARATATPTLTLTGLHGVVDVAPAVIAFRDVAAGIAGGKLTAQATVAAGAGGVTAQGQIGIAGADAGKILRNSAQAPVGGALSAQVSFDSAGATPLAFVSALRGSGTLTIANAQIAALDPKALDAAVKTLSQDRTMAIAQQRVADVVVKQLDAGALRLPSLTVPVEMSAGRVRIGKVEGPPVLNDIAASASLDIPEQTLDARFTLVGTQTPDGPPQRPEVSMTVKGAVEAPRRSVDVSALVGWLTLQAVDRESKRLEAEEREAKKRAQLEALIREKLADPALAPQPAPAPPAANPKMPPPPGAADRVPRAPRIESTPLPLVP